MATITQNFDGFVGASGNPLAVGALSYSLKSASNVPTGSLNVINNFGDAELSLASSGGYFSIAEVSGQIFAFNGLSMNRGIGALGNVYVVGLLDGVEVASQQILNILSIGTRTISVSGPQWNNLTEIRVYAGDTINISLGANFTIDDVQITDAIAPLAALITSGSGATNDTTPAVSGTAEAGATVSLLENGVVIGTATVGLNGTFSVSPTNPLGQGGHSLTVQATDAAGNAGPASGAVSVTVDTLAPAAPVVTSGSGATNDATPAVSGTAEAGATVSLLENGVVIGTATVGLNGAFSVSPTNPLGQGGHSLTVQVTDAAGNTGPASGAVSVTVDTLAPAAPVVLSGSGATNDATPAVSGTAEAGATVSLLENGVVIGTATVGLNGTFSVSPTNPLGQGGHSLTVQATDAAGNAGPASGAVSVTIDTLAPAAPIVTSGSGATNDATPAVSGTAEAGATVSLLENGAVIGTATVGPNGAFSVSPTNPLPDGGHALTVVARDMSGNTGPASGPVGITVDTAPPATPVVTGGGGTTNDSTPAISGTAEAGSTVALLENGVVYGTAVVGSNGLFEVSPASALPQGGHSLTVQVTDAAGNTSPASTPVTVTITVADTTAPAAPVVLSGSGATNDATPAVSGTAEAGATVSLLENGAVIGTATVGPNGAFSVSPTNPLPDGGHALTVVARDMSGNTGPASGPVGITVDTAPPATPVVTGGGGTTNDSTPAISGTAEAGSTVALLENGVVYGTAVVGSNGLFEVSPASALPQGGHSLTVQVTDAAGNTSPASTPVTVTITVADTTAPAAPVVLSGSGATNDATPAVSGTAEAGATVSLLENGAVIGTATVGPNGAFSVSPTNPLPDGGHALTVVARDMSGNTGPASGPVGITVDTAPPATPVVTGGGGTTNDSTPAISGTAEAGSTVALLENGVVYGTAVVGPNGLFEVSPASALPQGGHSLTVQVTDAAGNTSPASTPVAVTITVADTTAPAAPVVLSGSGATNDATPAVSGTAEAGATVSLLENGAVIGTATVGPNGAFSVSPTNPLPDGGHALTVVARDMSGNTGPASGPVGITVDTAPPATPVVTGGGGTTNDSTPAISGTAEAGSTVVLTENGTVIGTGTANGNGTFSVSPANPLADGGHSVMVQSIDQAGNHGSVTQPLQITIATSGPHAAISGVSGPTNLVDHVVSGSLDVGSGATAVTIADGSVVLGTAPLDASGHWSLPFTFTDGGPTHTYHLVATATNAQGVLGASDAFDFTLDFTPNQPSFGIVTQDVHSAGGQVYALYEGLLGRAPDALGLEFWADAFSDGVAPSALADGFLKSAEGMARAGAVDNATFVTQLYNATLHRDPDAVGLNFWTSALDAGAKRADVGVGFALSAEHLNSLQPAIASGLFVPDPDASAAARIYYTVLSRAPDKDGLAFWTHALEAGTPLTVETTSFLSTSEVQTKTAGLTTSAYVDLVYTASLGRHAEAGGLKFWTDAIDSHVATRTDVTTEIGQSPEAQGHLLPLIQNGWHLA